MVIVYSWPNFTAKKGAETPGDPQNLLFQNGQLITMAFVPANATVPKPPASVITSLITADQSGPTTPTTTTDAAPRRRRRPPSATHRPDHHATSDATTPTTTKP